MDVEHLWHYNEMELNKLNTDNKDSVSKVSHPFLVESGLAGAADASSGLDFVANLCNIADHRLYKIVKWCKSLPLFKNISVSLQILFFLQIINVHLFVLDRRSNMSTH